MQSHFEPSPLRVGPVLQPSNIVRWIAHPRHFLVTDNPRNKQAVRENQSVQIGFYRQWDCTALTMLCIGRRKSPGLWRNAYQWQSLACHGWIAFPGNSANDLMDFRKPIQAQKDARTRPPQALHARYIRQKASIMATVRHHSHDPTHWITVPIPSGTIRQTCHRTALRGRKCI